MLNVMPVLSEVEGKHLEAVVGHKHAPTRRFIRRPDKIGTPQNDKWERRQKEESPDENRGSLNLFRIDYPVWFSPLADAAGSDNQDNHGDDQDRAHSDDSPEQVAGNRLNW